MSMGKMFLLLLAGSLASSAVTLQGTMTQEDGSGLPGVAVVALNPSTGRTYTTLSGGNGDYKLESLPPGTYHTTFTLDGFKTAKRIIDVRVVKGDSVTRDVMLKLSEVTEAIVVTGATDAATYVPADFPQAGLPKGGIAIGYTNNGPDTLAQATSLPLQAGLNIDGKEWRAVLKDYETDEEIPTGAVYATKNQFAFVTPSNIKNGVYGLGVKFGNIISGYYDVLVQDAKPGIYSSRGNGTGRGLFTDPLGQVFAFDNPITRDTPYVTGWGQGWGPAPFFLEGGVYDKRPDYQNFSLQFGSPLEPKDQLYVGSAADFAGGDQIIFVFPDDAPEGCAVPLTGGFVWGEEPVVNIGLFGPVKLSDLLGNRNNCEDRHFINGDFANDLYGLKKRLRDSEIRVSRFTTNSFVDPTTRKDRLWLRYEAHRRTWETTSPPNALGTCGFFWTLPDLVDPFAAASIQPSSGTVRVTIPGSPNRVLEAGPTSNAGPYSQVYSVPDGLGQGNYTGILSDLSVADPDGESAILNQQESGEFPFDIFETKEKVGNELRPSYLATGKFTMREGILALLRNIAASPRRENTFGQLLVNVNNGEHGIFSISCYVDGGSSAPADQLDRLLEQLENLVPLVPSEVPTTVRDRVFRAVSPEWKSNPGFINYSQMFVDGYDDWAFDGLPPVQ